MQPGQGFFQRGRGGHLPPLKMVCPPPGDFWVGHMVIHDDVIMHKICIITQVFYSSYSIHLQCSLNHHQKVFVVILWLFSLSERDLSHDRRSVNWWYCNWLFSFNLAITAWLMHICEERLLVEMVGKPGTPPSGCTHSYAGISNVYVWY